MSTNRVTVSLDDDAADAIEELTSRTGLGRSELVRRSLTFYLANYQAATSETSAHLVDYHKMLSGGEHVLLDIDFLHCFLDFITGDDGVPDDRFLDAVDQVSDYHALEYEDRFESIDEVLEWLSLCGFLSVRQSENQRYHIVFPSEKIRWFMTRFIEHSTANMPVDVEIEEGLTKVLLVAKPPVT